MTFRNRVQFLLVHTLMVSNKEAIRLLASGQVLVNGTVELENVILSATDEVRVGDKVIKEAVKLHYIAFYKPRGIETTLNPNIQDNLINVFPVSERLFPIGRLDKESEGLLILTNDGDLYNAIIKKENKIEKEYTVAVDLPINDEFILKMSSGIKIMGRITLPCQVEKLNDRVFRIVLTQGLNRQIRRMCYQMGFEVVQLKRTRIGYVWLEDLQPTQYRLLQRSEIVDA